MRDQRDGQLVHARIPRELSDSELGQLAVVALGEAVANFSYVFADYMIVIEEPVAGRTYIHVSIHRPEPLVRVLEDLSRLFQPREKPCSREAFPARNQPLRGGDFLRTFGKLLRAEQFAADGSHRRVPRTVGCASDQGG